MKPFYSLFVCVLAFLLSGISQHATPAHTMGTQQIPQAASPYPWVGAGGEALVGSAAGDSFERLARSSEDVGLGDPQGLRLASCSASHQALASRL